MNTTETTMLNELKENATLKARKQLHELFKEYDLCVLGEEVHEEEISEIITQVLAEGDFRAKETVTVRDDEQPRQGERVTSEKWSFLLSAEDFSRLMDECVPRWNAAGLTDAEGTSTPAWTVMKVEARRALLDFIIENIIPSALRDNFRNAKYDYTAMEKLIEISRAIA